jgi:hypothetical protein
MRVMGQGFPLMAHNTDRVPTLSGVERGGETTWIGNQVRLERR